MTNSDSYIRWPGWMPKPQQDSFAIQPEDRRLTTETESGGIIRYQFDSDVNVADCTLILNRMQSAWFETFERDFLRQGSVWFDFPLWIGGEIVYESCRFKTRPKAGSLIGLHTTYTFSLYVSSRSQLAYPKCITEILLCWSPRDFCCLHEAYSDLFNGIDCLSEREVCAYRILFCIPECDMNDANENIAESFMSGANITAVSISDAFFNE